MGKTASLGSLADAVRQSVTLKRAGPPAFIERLPRDAQDELLEVRRQFQAGGFGDASAMEVSRRVHAFAADRGWKLVSVKELSLWLRR